jgi:hypothetical protein
MPTASSDSVLQKAPARMDEEEDEDEEEVETKTKASQKLRRTQNQKKRGRAACTEPLLYRLPAPVVCTL